MEGEEESWPTATGATLRGRARVLHNLVTPRLEYLPRLPREKKNVVFFGGRGGQRLTLLFGFVWNCHVQNITFDLIPNELQYTVLFSYTLFFLSLTNPFFFFFFLFHFFFLSLHGSSAPTLFISIFISHTPINNELFLHIHALGTHARTHTRARARTHTCTHTFTHKHTHTHTHTHIYTNSNKFTHTLTYIRQVLIGSSTSLQPQTRASVFLEPGQILF